MLLSRRRALAGTVAMAASRGARAQPAAPVRLFQVKAPAESRMPWDLYDPAATTPADWAWRPMSGDGCPMVHA